jgi:mRNA-degrading endonuclease RelE of RelBE toxin-antitoxin system
MLGCSQISVRGKAWVSFRAGYASRIRSRSPRPATSTGFLAPRLNVATNIAIIQAMFTIRYSEEASADLVALDDAYLARRIVADVKDQLTHEPAVKTRRKKEIVGEQPAFEHNPPIWQLRVGDFRIFYDVDPVERVVSVRAIRYKGNLTTKEIL